MPEVNSSQWSMLGVMMGATLGLLSLSAQAQNNPVPQVPPPVRADASGFWINEEQPAHGVHLEVLEGGRALIGWYTYGSDGQPLWLIGEGDINGFDVSASLLQFSDGRPPAQWSSAQAQSEVWGQVTLSINGCNDALLSWDSDHPGFDQGSLELTRFTRMQGSRCMAESSYSEQRLYTFHRENPGFEAVFGDLPADYDQEIYELDFSREVLPAPLDHYVGLKLTGHNRSDDLVMMLSMPVRGLQPDTYYRVNIDAELASNVPSGCVGIGGAPGESVFVKLGASTLQPATQPDDNGWLRLNVDHGNQAIGGPDARLAGTLGNSYSCDDSVDAPWELLSFSAPGTDETSIVRTDGEGTMWLNVATDSGFEGKTVVYLTRAQIRLTVW